MIKSLLNWIWLKDAILFLHQFCFNTFSSLRDIKCWYGFSALFISDFKHLRGNLLFYSKYILVDAICHAPKLDRLVLKSSHSINHFWKSNNISAMGFLLIILKFITSKVHSDKTPFHKMKGCRRNVDTSTN